MSSETPVLIAGGGLVGLSTALFLGRMGIRALLVERHTGTSRLPRGRGLNVRTMEILRQAGVEPDLHAAPASVLRDLPEIARADALADPESFLTTRPEPASFSHLSPTGPITIDQNTVEPILREHAVRLGQELLFGTSITGFRQDIEGVGADLLDRETGTRRQVRARYLVAADGHRSRIRAALGIGTSGRGDITHYLNIPFEADLGGPLRGRRLALCYLDRPEPGTMLTRIDDPRRWILMVPYRPGEGDSAERYGTERCTALVREAVGVPDLRVRLLEDALDDSGNVPTWCLASWVADRFRDGRVFLVGDSAHVTPPAGGLGGNMGVQDAHNLAWKLAAVLRGEAGPGLLGTYEAERRRVAVATCEYSLQRQLARKGSADTADQSDPVAMALGYHYRSGAVCTEPEDSACPPPSLDDGGRPGSRAPHVELRRDGVPISTIDSYRDRFVLVTGPRGHRWAQAAREAGVGTALEVLRIGRELQDPQSAWRKAHGVGDSGAVLVRPDGFVGWRAESDSAHDPRGTLEQAFDTLLSR